MTSHLFFDFISRRLTEDEKLLTGLVTIQRHGDPHFVISESGLKFILRSEDVRLFCIEYFKPKMEQKIL